MRQLVVKFQDQGDMERAENMHARWVAHVAAAIPAEDSHTSNEKLELDQLALNAKPLNLCWQMEVLCRRNVNRLIKDSLAFKARIMQNLVLSLIVGLIYFQLDLDQTGVQNFSGALFFITVNRLFMDASPEFMLFPLELPIVLREHRSGLYYSGSWFLSKNLSELPFQVFLPLISLPPIYFLIGFGDTVATYFTFLLILVLLSSCAIGMGYMVACIAGKPEIVSNTGPIIILPFLLFGGLFLNSNTVPD